MSISNSMAVVSCLRTLLSPLSTSRRPLCVPSIPKWVRKYPILHDPLFSVSPTALTLTRKHVMCSSTPTHQAITSPAQQHQGDDEVVEKEMEELICKIGDELASFESIEEEEEGTEQLSEALKLVDLVVRLGIQRFFKHQIDTILDLTYKQWKEESGLVNAGLTTLGFCLLRLHGYQVSADVFKTLKDENGNFSCFSLETLSGISGMLNLYKCSQLGFPSESAIMKEVKKYTRVQLNNALSTRNPLPFYTSNLSMEIKFVLDYPRRCLLSRLESRSIVRQMWTGDERTKKYLELAKLDIKVVQKLHQQEIKELTRWWTEQNFDELKFARERIAKCLFAVSANIFEPQFSVFRIAFVKTSCLVVILDDLFDDENSNIQELQRFSEAIKRWDPSLIDDLPQHKSVFTGIYDTMLEMAEESSQVQGRDLVPFFKDLWADQVCAFLEESEWIHSQHVPTFEDYLKLAVFSIAGTICTWTSIFLMGELITDEVLQYIGKDSRFMYLAGLVGRLSNDLVGFDKETREGKTATAVSCYLRDHPQCTREEAFSSLRCLIESSCEELEWELYQSRAVVPECLSRAVLNYARTMSFVYKVEDGFTDYNSEYMQLFKDYLFDPLP